MCGNVVLYKLHPVLNTKLFVAAERSLLVSDTSTNCVLAVSICYWTNPDLYDVIISLLQLKEV